MIKPFITLIIFSLLISIADIILFKKINLNTLLKSNSMLVGTRLFKYSKGK